MNIAEVFHADTGVREQLGQVEGALRRHPDADFLIGSAPAIEAAMGLAATGIAKEMPTLIATYVSHTVLRGLSGGRVRAVAFDDPQAQGRIAIRHLARVLMGDAPSNPGFPIVDLLQDPVTASQFQRLSPPDFFPVSR